MLFGGTETMPSESPILPENQGSATNRMVDNIQSGTTVMCPFTLQSRLTGLLNVIAESWSQKSQDSLPLRFYSVIAIVPPPIIAVSLRPAYRKLHCRILSGNAAGGCQCSNQALDPIGHLSLTPGCHSESSARLAGNLLDWPQPVFAACTPRTQLKGADKGSR